ncbi:recombinase family protein [Streptomyces celluloflavus]|uniref:recombinase family protein n=1 Tax=Streptomyces celluloflavus TaxID=58344 RepID=UPI0036DAD45D
MTTTVRLTCYATKINLTDTGCSVGPHGRRPAGPRQQRADRTRRPGRNGRWPTQCACPGRLRSRSKASDKLARRSELDRALDALRAGDQLVVTKLDRLGRSLENLIELSKRLEDDGVALVVLDQGIDTSTAIGRMFFQILGAIAEFEHALISERTMDGLAAARARGRTGGQKPKLGPRQVQLARAMYEEKDDKGHSCYTVAQIADALTA